MAGDQGYALSKLSQAVGTLAVGEGDIRQRLCSVAIDILILSPEDLPEDLRRDLAWIRGELTKRPANDFQSAPELTLRHMKNKTASRIASRIIDLEARLRSMLQSG